MMIKSEYFKCSSFILVGIFMGGCLSSGELVRPEPPSLAYARQMHSARFENEVGVQAMPRLPLAQSVAPTQENSRAGMHFVKQLPPEEKSGVAGDIVTNMPDTTGEPNYHMQRNTNPHVRPYHGPLHLGEPGASASLWRASGQGSQLFRDHRAFQPMDLITIIISEKSEGTKEADTNAKRNSSILMGISKLFNFTDNIESKNPGVDASTLVDAKASNNFKGEGDTSRKGSLRASLSAVVAEVYPNGIMRIEGEKIIAVNNEEQIIVISGLVRPKDVNSANEVMSNNIGNLRIDYFGKGVVDDVQSPGWATRILNNIWPF